MIQNVRLYIHGKVQGVSLRAGAKRAADSLSLYGFVENLSDGSVLIEAQGKKQALSQLEAWCHTGTRSSRIDKVSKKPGKINPKLSSFEIKLPKKRQNEN